MVAGDLGGSSSDLLDIFFMLAMLKTAVRGKGPHPFYFMLFMIAEQACGSLSNWVALNSEKAFVKISLKTKFVQFAILNAQISNGKGSKLN